MMKSCWCEGRLRLLGTSPLPAPRGLGRSRLPPGMEPSGISQTAVMLCQCDSPPEPPENVIPKLPRRRNRSQSSTVPSEGRQGQPALPAHPLLPGEDWGGKMRKGNKSSAKVAETALRWGFRPTAKETVKIHSYFSG